MTDKIRELNDRFRAGIIKGKVFVTAAVQSLSEDEVSELLEKVRNFTNFSSANDPWSEHDFGAIRLNDEEYFWKIDYYDKTLTWHSQDPADDAVTERILTIMRSDEY